MARKAEVIFVGDASSLVRASAEAKAAIDSVSKSANKSNGPLSSLPTLGGNLTTGLIAAAPAAMGLVGALGALTASAGAAVAGMGALAVGGVGSLVAGFGSIALVAKPAVTQFQNVTKALDAYNLKMANSSTTAKQAAAAQKTLNAVVSQNGGSQVLSAAKAWDALGTSFGKLTGSARGDMFTGLTDSFKAMQSLIPTVATIANKSMGSLVSALQVPLQMFTGSKFKADLTSMGDTFSKAIGPGVSAASKVFLAFSNIAAAAGPYVVQLTKGIDGLATKFLGATSNSKELGKDIGSLVSQAKSWTSLIGALGKLIFDVFKQGASSGQGMVNSLTGVLNQWDKWVLSTKGSKSITDFFQNSVKFTKDLFAALGPVVASITSLAAGPLPIYSGLLTVLEKTTANLGVSTGVVVDAFVAYKVALVGATIVTGTFSAATKVAAAATTAWAAVTATWATLSKVAATAMVAWTIATDGQSIATKAATAAQIAFDLAMDVNPIILVVTAVAALAAAMVYLATKTKFFQDAWKALKSAFADVKNFITGVSSDMVSHLVADWNRLKGSATAAWGGIKSGASAAWHDISSTASSVWGDIEGTISGAVRGAVSTVKTVVNDMKSWLGGAWKTISKGVSSFASDVESGITNAFDSAVNTVIGFVNDIIGALDKIPGVNISKVAKLGGNGGGKAPGVPSAGSLSAAGFATGGVVTQSEFARGGHVGRPMVVVGEEAPSHPEVVIATNPAYRSRNLGLFAEAGKRLGVPGFATGGMTGGGMVTGGPHVSYSQLEALWTAAGGPKGTANTAAAIAEAESGGGYDQMQQGQPFATTGWGYWQITPGGPQYYNPMTNAREAVSKYKAAGGFSPWTTYESGAYRGFLQGGGGGGGGVLNSIGNFFSGAGGAVSGVLGSMLSEGAGAITKLLPGIGSLPKWLAGTGTAVLKDVTGWIGKKVSGVVNSLFGGGGSSGPSNTSPAAGGDALKVQDKMFAAAKNIIGLPYVWGGGHGSWDASGYDCSGAVSYVLHAANLLSSPEATGGLVDFGVSGPGKYITVGVTNDPGGPGGGHTMIDMFGQFFESGGQSSQGPHWDHGWSQSFDQYRHPAGYAQGGVLGVPASESKLINSDMGRLAALMGPHGDYARQNENISYYPSLWQTSNSLLGSTTASSFINTTDALGNPIAPTIDTSALGLTRGEESKELGWYSSQVGDIRKSVPLGQKVLPKIQDAIKRLKHQIASIQLAAKLQIKAITEQIRQNLLAMRDLQAKITKAQGETEPHPNPKNASQRKANAAWSKTRAANIANWHGQYVDLEVKNKALGGVETSVGTGGQIGSTQAKATSQVAAVTKQIAAYQTDLSAVTGSGAYSPLTLQGLTGLGGQLGPALLQQDSIRSQTKAISNANIQAALQAAQQSYASGVAANAPVASTATPATTPTAPVVVPTGPTTTSELSSLLAGMPPLAYRMGGILPYGGARATGGPVQPGYVYRVGERGPEDVAFGQSGTVMTAAQTRQNGGAMMHIEHAHFSGATAAKAAVDRLAYRAAIGVA